MQSNFVFSKTPPKKINTEDGQQANPAFDAHKPTPEFTGRRTFATGQKAGQPTPAYKKWIKENMNKPDFSKPNVVGGQVSTVKLGIEKDATRYTDKRRKDLVIKQSVGAEFSKGILRPKPSSKQTFTYTYDGENFMSQISPFLKGKTGKYVIRWEGGNFEVDLTGDWKVTDYENIWAGIAVTSGTSYFGVEKELSGRTSWDIEILKFDNVKFKPTYKGQIYADNQEGTCIIDPLYNYFSKQTSKTGQMTAKCLKKKMEKYKNGLNEEQIQAICDAHRLHITIYHPTTGFPILDLKTRHKCQKHFKYKNTRNNHAEGWKYPDFFDIPEEEVIQVDTQEEMIEIFKQQKGEFVYQSSQLIQGTSKISYINTPENHYRLANPFKDVTDGFYKQYPKLNNHLEGDVNDVRDVNHFINSATYVNGIHDFNIYDGKQQIYEHDINKAYATFNKCKYYKHYQFPDIPTDFRNVSGQDIDLIINKTGWTQIYKIQGKGNAFELANLQEGGVYPNVELRCLRDLGVKFKIKVSAWSSNKHTFEFDDEMLEEIDHPDYKKVKPYAVESGKMLAFVKAKKVYYKYDCEPTQEWIDNMSYYDPLMSSLWNNQEEQYMIIEQKKTTLRHRNHIGSYLTAYVRCRMYEEIEKYKREDLWFVRSDAIKLKGDYEVPDHFKLKTEEVKLHEDEFQQYMNKKEIRDDWDCGEYQELENKCIYLGAGGTGKSYSFMNDKGLVFKAIALPTNELKGGIDYKHKFTHHGVAPLRVGFHKKTKEPQYSCTFAFNKLSCGNLFVDEITMRNYDECKRLLEITGHRLIFAGDWDIKTGMVYQLQPTKDVFPYKLFQNIQTVNFTKNYRSKDKRLTNVLQMMRDVMLRNYGRNCLKDMNLEFTKVLKSRKVDEEYMYKNYKVDDLAICSMNRTQQEFNKVFDEKNQMIKKWKITKKTDKYCNGEFVRGDVKTENKELAYATTIHAVQGKTFKNKLFVDLGNIFEWGMYYTAVSRLTTLDDLYLVD